MLGPNEVAACSEREPCLLHRVPPPDQGWRELVPQVEVRPSRLLRLVVAKPEPVVALVKPDHRPEHAVCGPTQERSVAWGGVPVSINAWLVLWWGWGRGAWHFCSYAFAMATAIRVHKRSEVVHRLGHHCANISHERNAVACPPHREAVVRSRASLQNAITSSNWIGRAHQHNRQRLLCFRQTRGDHTDGGYLGQPSRC